MGIRELKQDLKNQADPGKARTLMRFFKTGKGEYGEGDRFMGITMPAQRLVAARHDALPLRDLESLLDSPWHEERMTALLILLRRHRRGDDRERKSILKLYLRKRRRINNWDLVDVSAEHILGAHCLHGDRALLFRLARSRSLWDRRIALMSTFHFIRKGDFSTTLALAEALLDDREDLIHKAAGWMLREIGKRDDAAGKAFLDRHVKNMPRTMLRYAIEKFPPGERARYLRA